MIRRSTFATGRFALTLLAPAVFGLTATAQAQVPISFSTVTNGNASTQTTAYGIMPSAGTQQFLLTTINPAPSDGSLGTTSANTNVTTLNTYFGLPTGTLAGLNAQAGSGYLSQQVTLTMGSVVHFDYIFLTSEDNTLPTPPAPSQFHNDLAFFTVNGAFNQIIYTAIQIRNHRQSRWPWGCEPLKAAVVGWFS